MTPEDPTESTLGLTGMNSPPAWPMPASDDLSDPPAGDRYNLLDEIGSGGMGIVFRAQAPNSPVIVALKIIKMGMDTRRFLHRFRVEREMMLRLNHPGITRVLDAGNTVRGRPYYVMEYVPGSPVTKFADDEKLTLRDRLELFIKICDAVSYAHTKAVIHRDLKPSNLLAYRDEKGALVTKVIDFGVAKVVRSEADVEESVVTETGAALGTVQYMSPEQAEGSRDVDVRADVYSLGAVLYELLVGARPFDAISKDISSADQLRRLMRDREPSRPSTRLSTLGDSAQLIAEARQTQIEALSKSLRNELEWIPLKAMRKSRDKRYHSAQQLAADVQNYLDGNLLIVGLERKGYATKKWVKKHRAVVAAAAMSIVCLAAASVLSTYFAISAQRDSRIAAAALDDAKRAEERVGLARKDLIQKNAELQAQRNEAVEARRAADEARAISEALRQRAEQNEEALQRALTNGSDTEKQLAQQNTAVKRLESELSQLRDDGKTLAGKLQLQLDRAATFARELDAANLEVANLTALLGERERRLAELVATTQRAERSNQPPSTTGATGPPTRRVATVSELFIWCLDTAERRFHRLRPIDPTAFQDGKLPSLFDFAPLQWTGPAVLESASVYLKGGKPDLFRITIKCPTFEIFNLTVNEVRATMAAAGYEQTSTERKFLTFRKDKNQIYFQYWDQPGSDNNQMIISIDPL